MPVAAGSNPATLTIFTMMISHQAVQELGSIHNELHNLESVFKTIAKKIRDREYSTISVKFVLTADGTDELIRYESHVDLHNAGKTENDNVGKQ